MEHVEGSIPAVNSTTIRDKTFSALYANALQNYRSHIGGDLDDDPDDVEISSIEEMSKRITLCAQNFSNFRHKHDAVDKVRDVLKKYLQSADRATKIVKAGFANSPFGPVSAVFSATMFLIQVYESVYS